MTDKRMDRRGSDLTVEMESLRNADVAGRATDQPPPTAKSDEEKITLFWRVFGGTILSIVTLIGITLFNSIASGISELRAEMARINEARSEYAKRDEVNAVKLLATTHAGYRTEIDSLKDRATKYRTEMEDVKKEFGSKVESLAKSEAAVTESLKKDLAAMETVKEKLAGLTVEIKSMRDDTVKLRVDVDRNQAADNERRERRDSQMKQLDDTVKELAKTVQETREKLARLEGQQGPTKPTEVGPPRPNKTGTGTPPEKE